MRATKASVLVGITALFLMVGATTVFGDDATEAASEVVVKPFVSTRLARPSMWASPKLQYGLMASFATLQALDVVSTVNAVGSGRGQEQNPMMGGLAESPVAFALTKGGLTVATAFLMHRVAKDHPKRAAITLIALNIGYTFIVSSNFRIAAGR